MKVVDTKMHMCLLKTVKQAPARVVRGVYFVKESLQSDYDHRSKLEFGGRVNGCNLLTFSHPIKQDLRSVGCTEASGSVVEYLMRRLHVLHLLKSLCAEMNRLLALSHALRTITNPQYRLCPPLA